MGAGSFARGDVGADAVHVGCDHEAAGGSQRFHRRAKAWSRTSRAGKHQHGRQGAVLRGRRSYQHPAQAGAAMVAVERFEVRQAPLPERFPIALRESMS
jgi:hypothetical protein